MLCCRVQPFWATAHTTLVLQASRQLQRLNIEPELQHKLRHKGLTVAKDVLLLSSFELVELLDISHVEAKSILSAISSAVVPQPGQVASHTDTQSSEVLLKRQN